MARNLGGRFLVRIEDIDLERSRPEYVAAIFEDLAWLGLSWEQPVLHQSTRFAAYQAATRELRDQGLIYPCFATRSDILAAYREDEAIPRDPDGAPLYPSDRLRPDETTTRKYLAAGKPHAWRLDMERAVAVARSRLNGAPLTFDEHPDIGPGSGPSEVIEARPAEWGDAIIVRKETPTSYTLAVVVDDAFQGITHVVRGRDLYAATGLQRLLQVLLGLPPPVYHHHALILDEGGQKLSKSTKATSLASLRAAGRTPSEVWRTLGIAPEEPEE